MAVTIKFGTDGWRAIIAEDYTFENVRICAQSVANFLIDKGTARAGLVIGYDTRFESESFAAAVAEVMAANGVPAYLCNKTAPTPTVSFNILAHKAAGAVVITASHNPGIWNGFKYKPEYAGSASPEVVAELERGIASIQAGSPVNRVFLDEGIRSGLIKYIDPDPPYLDQVARMVDLPALRDAGLRIVADAMYGAGIGYFQRLLSGGKTEVIGINQERNPIFPGIQPEPITQNLGKLMEEVPRLHAQLGLATDGDSDRIGIVDEHGNFVNQLWVYGLLALYSLEIRGQRGPLVKSLSTTSMIDRLGELYGVPVYETAVGFKYIGPKMLETGAIIGGEESGGFGFQGHIPERDGIVAGLFIADMVVKLGRSPSQLVQYLFDKVGAHHYHRVDLHFRDDERGNIIERIKRHPPTSLVGVPVERIITVDGYKYLLSDGSWLLIRFSGTEPIMRIYSEASSPERVQQLLEAGRSLAGV